MSHDDLTLELLVRMGNIAAVNLRVSSLEFTQPERDRCVDEAAIYLAINALSGETPWNWYSSRMTIDQHLSSDPIQRYFSSTTNTVLLGDLFDAIHTAIRGPSDVSHRFIAVECIKPVAEAIKRNINANGIRQKVGEMVKAGYALVFSKEDRVGRDFAHYLSIIDAWRKFINPSEVAQEAVRNIAKQCSLDDARDREFACTALKALIDLSDRVQVAALAYHHFGHEAYDILEHQVFDGYKPDQGILERYTVRPNVEKAIQDYEAKRSPPVQDAAELLEEVGDSGKPAIAKMFSKWFRDGRFSYLCPFIDRKQPLYNQLPIDIARKSLGEAITEACSSKDFPKLRWAIRNLPEALVDKENPEMEGFVAAYETVQEVRKR